MTHREIMQQALDALEYLTLPLAKGWDAGAQQKLRDEAITALREALAAQPTSLSEFVRATDESKAALMGGVIETAIKMQQAPMSQPNRLIAYSAANKLQELGYQWTGNEWALAQPEQEPVAWNWMQEGNPFGPAYYGNPPDADIQEVSSRNGKTVRLLYTTQQPQRQPLTDGKLGEIELSLRQYTDGDRYDLSLHDYARAIEAAHGIKEQS